MKTLLCEEILAFFSSLFCRSFMINFITLWQGIWIQCSAINIMTDFVPKCISFDLFISSCLFCLIHHATMFFILFMPSQNRSTPSFSDVGKAMNDCLLKDTVSVELAFLEWRIASYIFCERLTKTIRMLVLALLHKFSVSLRVVQHEAQTALS